MKVGIVGAGIMGRLLAFALINKGHTVTIYDHPTKKQNCSMTAAGMLSPISELEKSPYLIYELGMQALQQHWPKILKQLNQNIYFKQTGSLVVSHSNDKVDLERCVNLIKNKLSNFNSPEFNSNFNFANSDSIISKINSDELIQLEPELEKFSDAYHFQLEGQIDNQTLMHALKEYLIQHQVEWCEREIQNLPKEKFDWLFDCRGLGAKKELKNLQSVRGELIWLHAPNVNLSRPIRLMHPRYQLYVVPRPNHYFIIGASEIHSEDMSDISVQSTLEFLSAAYYLHPGFAEARVCQSYTQCRPTFPDYLPKIQIKNEVIAINGLYRHGYLIAPTLVSEIIYFIEQSKPSLFFPHVWEITAQSSSRACF